MTAAPASSSSSKSLWKRIFKHKKSLSESSHIHHDVTVIKEHSDNQGGHPNAIEPPEEEEEDVFPVFEFNTSSADFANTLSTPKPKSTHHSGRPSLALPNMTHKRTSKTTICTASTAFSTVNTGTTIGSASPCFTLASTPNRKGHTVHTNNSSNTATTHQQQQLQQQHPFKTSASHADEFSYSCAASTAWTGNITPTTTPSPGKNRAVATVPANTLRGTALPPLMDRSARNGGLGWTNTHSFGVAAGAVVKEEDTEKAIVSEEKEKSHTDKGDKEQAQEEEKDGFVELITERQMSRRHAGVNEHTLTIDNAPPSTLAPTEGSNKNNNSSLDTLQDVVSQGYYAQGYDLMSFHKNNPFQSNVSRSTQENERVPPPTQAKQEIDTTKNTDTNTMPVIETQRSESPDEPPNTQRKTVHPEFFMEEQLLPPSPTSKHRKQQQKQKHSGKDQHQQKATQQEHQQQHQQAQHNDVYDNNPNHLYAEINIKQRPHPVTRQGSEGTASLAMTSISSLTGHGSLFANDNSFDNGGLSPLPGGFWRIGSTIVKPSSNAAEEENYFDYTNDDTLKGHRSSENSEGMMDRLANIVNQMFYNTCQCFEVNNGIVPMSPIIAKRDTNSASVVDTKTLNETTVNGTNIAVKTVTTQGGNTVGNTSEPTFSVSMEN
ncbi:hypothetical protein ACHAW6_008211 [Cyclotella cf. meneghiniana]